MSGRARLFDLLLRVYPQATRSRFAAGMRYAWERDLAAARQRGRGATAAFWIVTVTDTLRFAAAERLGGVAPGGRFTMDWGDAWRSLRTAPLISVFAVLSLALGIGGATALFSILNSLALKPLAVREPQQLVLLTGSWTNPIWEAVRDRQQAFSDGAFAWANDRFNLSTAAASDMVEGVWVSGGMFDVLGVPAARGRVIGPADDVRGGGPAGPVAMISHAFWQRRFNADPAVVGRTLTIERVPFTIVGVAPERFFGVDVGRRFDVAIPLGTSPLVRPRDRALDERWMWWMNMAARLKPGATIDQALTALHAMQPQIRLATMPPDGPAAQRQSYLTDPFTMEPAASGRSPLRRTYQEPLTTVLWLGGLVLLIACGNIANLLMARASARRHEFTVRLALGASRFRIARQLLAESLVLAAAGAVAGLVLAQWGGRTLIAQLSTFANQVTLDLSLDWRVLAFATAVTGAAVVLFGVAPALTATRLAATDVLKDHGRGPGGMARAPLRQISVVLQVALSLVLAVGATLFVRTFVSLSTRDAGFTRTDVLLATALVDRNPVEGAGRIALFERFQTAAAGVPGVRAAAVSYTSPTARAGWNGAVVMPPGTTLGRRERSTWLNAVSPGWFDAFGLRFVAGRDFDGRDRRGAPLTAVVNRAFAQRFLQGTAPLGATYRLEGPQDEPQLFTVIGVVEDAVYRSLRAPMEPTMYIPIGQWDDPWTQITVAVRSAGGAPATLAPGLAAAIAREDPTAVLSFRTLEAQVDASLVQERLLATLASFFGALGLLLAAVGLYGVTAQAVAARQGELGIRMALGASVQGVIRLVLTRVARLVVVGVAIGAALSAWASTYVGTLLYGLQPRDPLTFVVASMLLMVVAGFAAWLPARRAARIDPMQTLRN